MKTLTGKRLFDFGLFILGFASLVHFAHEFRVYHRETRTEVTVVAVTSDGARLELETPPVFSGRQEGIFPTARRIRSFIQTDEGHEFIPENGQLEWSLHYETRIHRTESVWKMTTPNQKDTPDD